MNKLAAFILVFSFAGSVAASWYWPFGSDEEFGGKPRLSELVEPASLLIDEASDLVANGDSSAAIEKYREALDKLTEIEIANPERASTAEFASVRNKRAYVNAAIDSLLLGQARDNAKAVAVTDTTELEKKFAAKRNPKSVAVEPKTKVEQPVAVEPKAKPNKSVRPRKVASRVEKVRRALAKDPDNRRLRLAFTGELIAEGEFDKARAEIDAFLKTNPTDPAALNLAAACELERGDKVAAEKALDRAIQSNPRDYNAYYNMAVLKLENGVAKEVAARYYQTGRAVGGPRDVALEDRLK